MYLQDAMQQLRVEPRVYTPSPFGDFHVLPLEIRQILYHKCIKSRAVGLFFTNHVFYNESIQLLRERFRLSFHIDPTEASSKVKILNQDGKTAGSSSPHHSDYSSIVENMPTHLFGGIEILIDAPDPDDPGQLVRAWRQITNTIAALMPRWRDLVVAPGDDADIEYPKGVRDIATTQRRVNYKGGPSLEDDSSSSSYEYEVFEATNYLPSIVVKFQANGEGKGWITSLPSGRQIYNQSVPDFYHWVPETSSAEIKSDGFLNDYGILTTALFRVRHVKSLRNDVPCLPEEDYKAWARSVEEPTRIDRFRIYDIPRFSSADPVNGVTPFGLNPYKSDDQYCDGTWDYNDEDILRFEDSLHLWLDYLLDDMAGPTAAILRRERFASWCDEYEYRIGEYLYGRKLEWEHYTYGGLDELAMDLCPPSLPHRFWFEMRDAAYLSRHAAGLRHGQEVYRLRHLDRDVETGLPARPQLPPEGREPWAACFPDGIPRRSENPLWPPMSMLDTLRRRHWHLFEFHASQRDGCFHGRHEGWTARQVFGTFLATSPCKHVPCVTESDTFETEGDDWSWTCADDVKVFNDYMDAHYSDGISPKRREDRCALS